MKSPDPTELALKALTDWWVDCGVPPDVSVRTRPSNAATTRQPQNDTTRPSKKRAPAEAPRRLRIDPIAEARKLSAAANDISALKSAISGFEGCDLRKSARQAVVCDGAVEARVMLVGEAPGRDEDAAGLPFVGRSGQLLDRMFGSIGLSRQKNLYITNTVYWRPPANRAPSPEELAICAPFLQRQLELVKPDIIVAMGKAAAQALLNTNEGMMRLRGRRLTYQQEGLDGALPCIPMLHPAYLLRRPQDKALAWTDLLALATLCDELKIPRHGAA